MLSRDHVARLAAKYATKKTLARTYRGASRERAAQDAELLDAVLEELGIQVRLDWDPTRRRYHATVTGMPTDPADAIEAQAEQGVAP